MSDGSRANRCEGHHPRGREGGGIIIKPDLSSLIILSTNTVN